jgi:hypothetical protein
VYIWVTIIFLVDVRSYFGSWDILSVALYPLFVLSMIQYCGGLFLNSVMGSGKYVYHLL